MLTERQVVPASSLGFFKINSQSFCSVAPKRERDRDRVQGENRSHQKTDYRTHLLIIWLLHHVFRLDSRIDWQSSGWCLFIVFSCRFLDVLRQNHRENDRIRLCTFYPFLLRASSACIRRSIVDLSVSECLIISRMLSTCYSSWDTIVFRFSGWLLLIDNIISIILLSTMIVVTGNTRRFIWEEKNWWKQKQKKAQWKNWQSSIIKSVILLLCSIRETFVITST